jgi:hypothetical protein
VKHLIVFAEVINKSTVVKWNSGKLKEGGSVELKYLTRGRSKAGPFSIFPDFINWNPSHTRFILLLPVP